MEWIHMLVAFGIAVLAGLGVGSGGLLVVYLTLLCGAPQLQAQGVNLLFFVFSAGASMTLHLTRRRLLFPLCVLLTVCGIPGTLAGAYLAAALPGALLRRLFGVFLVIAGSLTLTKSNKLRAWFGKIHKTSNISG